MLKIEQISQSLVMYVECELSSSDARFIVNEG